MKAKEYVITDELGIHARPAGLLVKKCSEFESNINIAKGEKNVNAKMIFGIMGLGVKKGDTIIITADGKDEDVVIESVLDFLKQNL